MLLDGQYRLGEEVALPVSPNGFAWATLDLEPTLAGRLASFLFRPPLLTITIRYANGRVDHFRLVSALARAGFLLTPSILNTADMLSLLLPEHRTAAERPVWINISGQSGTAGYGSRASACGCRPSTSRCRNRCGRCYCRPR